MYVVVRWYKCGCTTSIRNTILWKLVRKISFRHLLCLRKKNGGKFPLKWGKIPNWKIEGFTYASIRWGYWVPYFKCILDIYRKSNFLKRVEDEIWFIGFHPIPKSMPKFRGIVKKGDFFVSTHLVKSRQFWRLLGFCMTTILLPLRYNMSSINNFSSFLSYFGQRKLVQSCRSSL